MIVFLENPNLPDYKVATVICATEDIDIQRFFEKNEIEVIPCQPNLCVDPSIKTHTDILALHIKSNSIVIDCNQHKLKQLLEKVGANVTFSEKAVAGCYPEDVKLNFAVIGKNVVGCFSYADETLTDKLKDLVKINVKQGYSKCSILAVNENAVITDDESIFRNLSEKGFDCLMISKGDVFLKGHEYGFIGGASGKISDSEVVFFGDIRKHRDFIKINEFLEKHNCKYICSDNNVLRDIGGFIPLQQRID